MGEPVHIKDIIPKVMDEIYLKVTTKTIEKENDNGNKRDERVPSTSIV